MNRRARWLSLSCQVLPFPILAVLLSSCQSSHSDALTEVRQRGTLRWGGDQEGGGPYIFPDPKDAERLTGFEIDLMAQLARGLGVRSEFKQCQWDDLLKFLGSRQCDVVVNGYELTPERLETAIATVPYYVYELHLFSRQDDRRLNGWDDLNRARPDGGQWTIGVLTSTAADNYLTKKYRTHVKVERLNGTTDAFRQVENGTLDATVTDTPAAVFYGPKFRVRQAAPPAERGYYVMYLRPADEPLRDALNAGLRSALGDGSLREIYQRYGLWGPAQERLTDPQVEQLPDTMRPAEPPSSGWKVVRRDLPKLLEAAWMTVVLSVVSMPLAITIGLLVALGRVYGRAWLQWPLTGYVEIIRGTPLLLQLLFLYYGLVPMLGLPGWLRDHAGKVSAVLGLALNYGAYEAEIYRAGLLAIPVGQTEAALALGLSRWQAIWHVVVPQAVRLVIPPVTNDFINLFKDTAVCSVIGVMELSKQYNMSVNYTPRAFFELAIVAAALYLAMSYPLALLTRRLEKKTAAARA
ncbi:MAG TPA: ABC transporter permease subunit [Gemmataceae bacterium]|nr:ABC transporter permease subunit [Gemmataceae bacterium]